MIVLIWQLKRVNWKSFAGCVAQKLSGVGGIEVFRVVMTLIESIQSKRQLHPGVVNELHDLSPSLHGQTKRAWIVDRFVDRKGCVTLRWVSNNIDHLVFRRATNSPQCGCESSGQIPQSNIT